MDKTVDQAGPLRFGPDLRLSAAVFLVGIAAAALAITSDDAESRLIFALAAVVLFGYSVGDVLFRPRLAADAAGLRIRTPLVRTDLAWAQVDDVRADVRRRHGIRTITLEVDAGATLIVFSRRALGAIPRPWPGWYVRSTRGRLRSRLPRSPQR